jgi:hypothetical protein
VFGNYRCGMTLVEQDRLPLLRLRRRKKARFGRPVWVGDRTDMDHLVKVLSEVLETRRKHLLADTPAASASIAKDWRLQCEIVCVHETVTGELDEAFDAVDLRTIERVHLHGGYESEYRTAHELDLVLTNERGAECGAKLKLESEDWGWVAESRQLISDALRRNNPWWGWVRSMRAAFAFGCALLAVGLFDLFNLEGSAHNFSLTFNVATWCVAGVIGMGAGWLVPQLFRRLLPRFEICKPGVTPTGRRVVGAFTTAVFAAFPIVLGVLALTQGGQQGH